MDHAPQEWRRRYQDDGFVIVPGLLEPDLASRLRQDMDRITAMRVYATEPPPGPMNGTVFAGRTLLGTASLESDHSLKAFIPSGRPLILEFIDGAGTPVVTMTEEHQVSPGEYITPGPPRKLFNNICGGCHGSISGSELDVVVSADALTGASVSASRNPQPKSLTPP